MSFLLIYNCLEKVMKIPECNLFDIGVPPLDILVLGCAWPIYCFALRSYLIIPRKVAMNHGETRKTITLENQPMPHGACFNYAAVCKHEVTRNKSHLCTYRPPCIRFHFPAVAGVRLFSPVASLLMSTWYILVSVRSVANSASLNLFFKNETVEL